MILSFPFKEEKNKVLQDHLTEISTGDFAHARKKKGLTYEIIHWL